MSTITIQLNGSTITGLTTNPSKNYTITDADLQTLLNWASSAFAGSLPASPTNPQILNAWIQSWIDGTKSSIKSSNQTISYPVQVTIA